MVEELMQRVAKPQEENDALKQQGTRAPEEGVRQPKREPVAMVGTAVPLGTPPMMPRVPDLPFFGIPAELGEGGMEL